MQNAARPSRFHQSISQKMSLANEESVYFTRKYIMGLKPKQFQVLLNNKVDITL